MSNEMITKKPWGKEKILMSGPYVIKELHINKGHRTSYQYHRKKTETMMILQGKAKVEYNTTERELGFHDIIHIPKLVMHRITALGEDCIIYEVSTPELDDIVRVVDDYKRIEVKRK